VPFAFLQLGTEREQLVRQLGGYSLGGWSFELEDDPALRGKAALEVLERAVEQQSSAI